jgi:hypothetical protein
VKLPGGRVSEAELHWYEAHGLGRFEMRIKVLLRYYDEVKDFVVVCVDASGDSAVELLKVYIGIDDPDAEAEGLLRVIDESGEDYLYSAARFVPVTLPAEGLERLGQGVASTV